MPRLEAEPGARPANLPELMSLAMAMEEAAAARYADLAAAMDARGEPTLAETFRSLLVAEREHAAQVADWSRMLTGAAAPAGREEWKLPPEIARSWDEVRGSTLLSPYRALSIAVQNEERSFALYAYVAANAVDEAVRRTAEQLAAEELHHAATLRRERRRAWRREREAAARRRGSVPSAAPVQFPAFAARADGLERAMAVLHRRIAAELSALGDFAGAALLEGLASARAPAAGVAPAEADGVATVEPSMPPDRAPLWRAALAALEALYDEYADMADHAADGEVLEAAQNAAGRAMRDLGTVAARMYVFPDPG